MKKLAKKKDFKQTNQVPKSVTKKINGKPVTFDFEGACTRHQLAQKIKSRSKNYKIFHYIDNRVEVEDDRGKKSWSGQKDIVKKFIKEQGAKLGDSLNYVPDTFTINESTMYSDLTIPEIMNSILFPPFLPPTICAKLLNDSMISTLIMKAPSVIMNAWIEVEATKQYKESSDREDSIIIEDKEKINKFLKEYNVKDLLYEALYKMNGMGGSVLYIDTGESDEDLLLPLRIDKYGLKNFKGFKLVENWQWTIVKSNWTQPLEDNYMAPEIVFIYNKYIHASRLLFIKNKQRPISTIFTQQYNYATQSDSERVMPYAQQYFARMNTTTNVQLKQNVMTYKTGAINLQNMNGQDLIRTLNNFNLMRDNFGVIAVDYDKGDVSVEHYHMPGWADLNAEAFALFAVIMDQPQSIVAKTPPPGFNASGDFDDMTFNQVCERWRTLNLESPLDKIIAIGKVVALDDESRVDNYTWRFGDLHKPKPEEKAKIFKSDCESLADLKREAILSAKDCRLFLKEKYAEFANMDENDVPLDTNQVETNV